MELFEVKSVIFHRGSFFYDSTRINHCASFGWPTLTIVTNRKEKRRSEMHYKRLRTHLYGNFASLETHLGPLDAKASGAELSMKINRWTLVACDVNPTKSSRQPIENKSSRKKIFQCLTTTFAVQRGV